MKIDRVHEPPNVIMTNDTHNGIDAEKKDILPHPIFDL